MYWSRRDKNDELVRMARDCGILQKGKKCYGKTQNVLLHFDFDMYELHKTQP